MNKQEFKNFVDKHKLESHWSIYKLVDDDLLVIIPTSLICEFQKIMKPDAMNDEFLNCDMGDDYFAIEIYSWLLNNDFSHEEIKEIFPNLDNNI